MGFPNFFATLFGGLIDRHVRRLRSSHGLLQDFYPSTVPAVSHCFECRKITKPGFNPDHINDILKKLITKVKLYEKQKVGHEMYHTRTSNERITQQ